MSLVANYKAHTEERAKLGVPPLALTAEQVADLVELLKVSPIAEQDYVMDMFENKIPAGVDDAAYVKAAFLNDVVQGNVSCDAIDASKACIILGKMLGGFNVTPKYFFISFSNSTTLEVVLFSNTSVISSNSFLFDEAL